MAEQMTRQHDCTIEVESGMRKDGDDPKYKARVVIRADQTNPDELPEAMGTLRALVALEMMERTLGMTAAWHNDELFNRARDEVYGDTQTPYTTVTIVAPDDLPDELREKLAELQRNLNVAFNESQDENAHDPASSPASEFSDLTTPRDYS
jgi:hypothetical protein